MPFEVTLVLPRRTINQALPQTAHLQKQERIQNVEDDLSPFANSRALARMEAHGITAVVSRILDHCSHLGCTAYRQPPSKCGVGAGAHRRIE